MVRTEVLHANVACVGLSLQTDMIDHLDAFVPMNCFRQQRLASTQGLIVSWSRDTFIQISTVGSYKAPFGEDRDESGRQQPDILSLHWHTNHAFAESRHLQSKESSRLSAPPAFAALPDRGRRTRSLSTEPWIDLIRQPEYPAQLPPPCRFGSHACR